MLNAASRSGTSHQYEVISLNWRSRERWCLRLLNVHEIIYFFDNHKVQPHSMYSWRSQGLTRLHGRCLSPCRADTCVKYYTNRLCIQDKDVECWQNLFDYMSYMLLCYSTSTFPISCCFGLSVRLGLFIPLCCRWPLLAEVFVLLYRFCLQMMLRSFISVIIRFDGLLSFLAKVGGLRINYACWEDPPILGRDSRSHS